VTADGISEQELVDQALSILRTIEEPALKTKRKKDQQTGIIAIIAQQLRRFLLLHEAQSQEETPEALEAKSDGSKASRKLRLAVEGLETAARVGNSDALFLLAEMNFVCFPRDDLILTNSGIVRQLYPSAELQDCFRKVQGTSRFDR
jgi:hypothetical protein